MTLTELEKLDLLLQPGIPMGGEVGRYAHWLLKLRKYVKEVEAERDEALRRAAEDQSACIEAERRVDEVMNTVRAASDCGDIKSIEETMRAAGAKIESLEARIFMLEAERDDAERERDEARDHWRAARCVIVGYSSVLTEYADQIISSDGSLAPEKMAVRLREFAADLDRPTGKDGGDR